MKAKIRSDGFWIDCSYSQPRTKLGTFVLLSEGYFFVYFKWKILYIYFSHPFFLVIAKCPDKR